MHNSYPGFGSPLAGLGIVVCGHTHEPSVKSEGTSLLVNPGECCGWVSGRSTIAIADTESRTAEIISL